MKVLLIGANGQLGTDVRDAWSHHDIIPTTHADLDVCDRAGVLSAIGGAKPDVVLNTSAFHNVDVCEDEPEKAFAVNAVGPLNLADACREHAAILVHLSTDYVFSGRAGRPYKEADPPDPANVYGVTKAAGEQLIRQRLERHFIVRGSGLFGVAGAAGKGGNFVETMLRLAREGKPISVVADQTLSPTSTADLAAKLLDVVASGRFGTFHVTGSGETSWHDFAAEIFSQCGLAPQLSATTTVALGARAPRPEYSVLANDALAAAGIGPMRHWREGLRAYLERKGHIAAVAST
jgi:dTDP-4-dehydrorhamnose reductase